MAFKLRMGVARDASHRERSLATGSGFGKDTCVFKTGGEGIVHSSEVLSACYRRRATPCGCVAQTAETGRNQAGNATTAP